MNWTSACITARVASGDRWSALELDLDALKERRDKLKKFHRRADEFSIYAMRAQEDETLYDGDAVYEAACKMEEMASAADDAVEALTEVIDAWDRIEDDLNFAFGGCARIIRKGVDLWES